ncbi:amino acid adenylation domain-containing protein [Streptomyces sp. NPDC058486]|uniref:amino acid adenylation domain-containing protein n=1 Tax=unclassified Streptomyces TaxID=2593676 RepID=UPI00366238FC
MTRSATLLSYFQRGLARSPKRTALVVGRERFTYEELDLRARELAGEVLAANPHVTRVGVLALPGERAYAGFLGALYAGAAAVPLHPDYPVRRTALMIEAARIDVLVVDAAGAARARELGAELAGVTVVERPTAPPVTSARPAAADDPAYIMFTSGSTGRPKGVPVSHGNVAHYLDVVQDRFGFSDRDVFSQTFNLTFDLAVFDMFAAWGCGGRLVAVPPGAYARLPEFVSKHGLTVWFSAPSVIKMLRRADELRPGRLAGLRLSLFCGEPLMCEDAEAWQRAADNSALHNLYGPTELTISCTMHRWAPPESVALSRHGIVPIGRPHPGLRYLLYGPGAEADTGELCVRGPQMVAGYLDPADDEGRFLDHEGERWYRTGDLVRRMTGGELAYLGRLDDQVNIGGVRMELREIEQALRGCAGVEDTVVLAVDDELAAFWVGGCADARDLRIGLADLLPRAMIPRRFERLEALPLNANGKTDRKALAERAAGGGEAR